MFEGWRPCVVSTKEPGIELIIDAPDQRAVATFIVEKGGVAELRMVAIRLRKDIREAAERAEDAKTLWHEIRVLPNAQFSCQPSKLIPKD